MRARRERVRLLLLAACGLAAAGLGVLAWATSALRPLELETVDARFAVRGSERPDPRVVVVGVDEQTLSELDVRPPLPRSLHARAIARLRAAGARTIAYDFVFTEPTAPRQDEALIAAVERAGNVVLATSRVGPHGEVDVFGGEEAVRAARTTVGVTNFPPRAARGGEIRRLPYEERGRRSFAVAAAGRTTGRIVGRGPFEGDGAWIDFAGPAGTYAAIPFVDVLEGRVPARRLRDRVVVVGATAPALQDVQAAATGEGMPGPEVNANAIATILDGFPLDDAPGWLAVALVALLGLAAPAAAAPLRGLRWLPVALVAGAAYVVVTQLAFGGGTILPLVPALLAFAVGLVGTLAATNATELRDRRRLRAQFARFVPAQVVDEVVDDLRLGGVRREGTVLFCDLRGFTAAAEDLPAERVIELLNRYLTEMSEAILDHGGTVVSYMGDGIMAVFGAPLEQADHADRALRAAREMLETRLPRFNSWARDFGLSEDFAVGIGVCSGPVMSGNVGSARRLEYAAVGDTTNTAARLEAMTKERGVPVLIADSTRAALHGPAPDLAALGELSLRGRAATLAAWTFPDGSAPAD